ncbi:hypothetical protein PO909_017170, partial [Leuciscus waleckii]
RQVNEPTSPLDVERPATKTRLIRGCLALCAETKSTFTHSEYRHAPHCCQPVALHPWHPSRTHTSWLSASTTSALFCMRECLAGLGRAVDAREHCGHTAELAPCQRLQTSPVRCSDSLSCTCINSPFSARERGFAIVFSAELGACVCEREGRNQVTIISQLLRSESHYLLRGDQ